MNVSISSTRYLPGALDHDAFIYRSPDEFVDFAVPFVHEGLSLGGEVVIAAAAPLVAGLEGALGGAPDGVTLHDTQEWAPHPATRLRSFNALVTERLGAGVPTLHLMGEPIWPSGPPALRLEWARYESVLNEVLAPYPVTLVCLYDGQLLDPQIVYDSGRTHPEFTGPGGAHPTGRFEPPGDLLSRWTREADPPPPGAVVLDSPAGVTAARRFVADQAAAAGVGEVVAADVAMAASEVLTNAELHGAGVRRVACWTEAGRFLCQVDDRGPGLHDPFAGYRPPSIDVIAGRGLWLARQLVELVEILPGEQGTTVRLRVPLAASAVA